MLKKKKRFQKVIKDKNSIEPLKIFSYAKKCVDLFNIDNLLYVPLLRPVTIRTAFVKKTFLKKHYFSYGLLKSYLWIPGFLQCCEMHVLNSTLNRFFWIRSKDEDKLFLNSFQKKFSCCCFNLIYCCLQIGKGS